MILGNAEQEIPAFEFRASTPSRDALAIDFLDVGEGRIGRLEKSLAAEFAVYKIVDFPEPARKSRAAGESWRERFFFVIL